MEGWPKILLKSILNVADTNSANYLLNCSTKFLLKPYNFI